MLWHFRKTRQRWIQYPDIERQVGISHPVQNTIFSNNRSIQDIDTHNWEYLQVSVRLTQLFQTHCFRKTIPMCPLPKVWFHKTQLTVMWLIGQKVPRKSYLAWRKNLGLAVPNSETPPVSAQGRNTNTEKQEFSQRTFRWHSSSNCDFNKLCGRTFTWSRERWKRVHIQRFDFRNTTHRYVTCRTKSSSKVIFGLQTTNGVCGGTANFCNKWFQFYFRKNKFIIVSFIGNNPEPVVETKTYTPEEDLVSSSSGCFVHCHLSDKYGRSQRNRAWKVFAKQTTVDSFSETEEFLLWNFWRFDLFLYFDWIIFRNLTSWWRLNGGQWNSRRSNPDDLRV